MIALPDDIIINIFKYTNVKLNMIVIFPWLSEFVPMCEFCNEARAYFIIHLNYHNSHVNNVERSDSYYDCFCRMPNWHFEKYNCKNPKYICKLDCRMLNMPNFTIDHYSINRKRHIVIFYSINYICKDCNSYHKRNTIIICGTQIQLLPHYMILNTNYHIADKTKEFMYIT